MLDKQIITGSVEILHDLSMQVREDTVIYEDGKEISRTYYRYVVKPEDDLETRPKFVKDLAAFLLSYKGTL